MAHAYILKNQHDLFLDRQGGWVDRAEASQLYRTLHKDEAINSMVELSVKHPELRIKIETCVLGDKGQLVLTARACDDSPWALSAIDPA